MKHYVYEDFVKAVGQKLYQLRKKAGYTQKNFSELFGWDQGDWSKIENGKKMTLKNLVKAANSFDLSVQELVSQAARRSGPGDGSGPVKLGKNQPD